MRSPAQLILTATGLLSSFGLATPTPAHNPKSKLPTRSSAGQQPLRLLHTSAPSAPFRVASSSSPSFRIAGAAVQESTKGGALLSISPDSSSNSTGGGTAQKIYATFVVPPAKVPTRGPTANNTFGIYAASFHLGIDSVSGTCGGSWLRAGIDIFYDGTLEPDLQLPQAWWQLGPANDPVGFANFTVREGDLVRVSVGVDEVKVENFGPQQEQEDDNVNGTTTKKACSGNNTKELVPSQVSAVRVDGSGLCGREAAWTVEDFPLAGLPNVPVALTDFGAVRFKDVGVEIGGSGSGSGQAKNADGATVSDVWLAAQGGRLTSCSVVDGGKEVKCERVFE